MTTPNPQEWWQLATTTLTGATQVIRQGGTRDALANYLTQNGAHTVTFTTLAPDVHQATAHAANGAPTGTYLMAPRTALRNHLRAQQEAAA